MPIKKSFETMTVRELEALVRRHNRLYFVEHVPEITDEEFDRLVEALKQRKPGSKVLQEVGSDFVVGERAEVRHETPMLSLDKCYDEASALDWAEKFSSSIIASPKIDGCAVSLRYNASGDLALAATRGNGVVGEDITVNVRYIKAVPQKISQKDVEVRGEIYMPLSVFAGYRKEFANPRNLAAGAIKQKDPKKTGEYHLSFWAYDLLGAGAKSEAQKRTELKKAGFPVVDWKELPKKDLQKVFEEFLAHRDKYDFETDGVVFKTNDVAEQDCLGATIHHPRFAIAYKFQGDSGVTRLKEIVWSVSRTGTITPVGIVEPVELSGATVTRVSLHHYGQVVKLGLAPGAKVLMMRRGGVIPNLESLVEKGKGEIHAPKRCPSCGAAVEVRDDFLYCTNPKGCLKARMGELKHFMQVIECEGFGDKLQEKLVTNGLVNDAADFFTLQPRDLVALERMGETLANKLVGRINEKRTLSLDVFLRALGIRELAKRTSQLLARLGSLDNVLAAAEEELAEIHGIGEVIAKEIVAGLKARRALINRLLKHVQIKRATSDPAMKAGPAAGPLVGKSVLFTGALLAMERKQAQHIVEAAGGVCASGVSKNLNFLVVGDGGGAGTKLTKARELINTGAPLRVLTEKEFLKMAGRKG